MIRQTAGVRCVLISAFVVATFVLLSEMGRQMLPRVGVESVAARHACLKIALIAITFAAWGGSRRPWSQLGLCRGKRGTRIAPWAALACLSMAAASAAMILTDSRHPMLRELTFPQIVVSIWLLSSVAEELLVRGLLQGWISPTDEASPLSAHRAAVVCSASAFAAMHLPLMWNGAGLVGGGVLVAATFGVGYACAMVRAQTGSLLLPVLLHVAANVTAPIGGIAGVVAYRLMHGHMPAIVS